MAVAWNQEDRKLDGVKSFIKNSGQYRLLYSHGTTFNYYRVFLEQALTLLAAGGRLGLIIDSGVASDAATAEHRRELLDHCTISQFVLCDNVNRIFPDPPGRAVPPARRRRRKAPPTRCPSPPASTGSKTCSTWKRRTLPIPQSVLRALAPDTLAIPDTRDPALLDLLAVIYQDRPLPA